MTIEQKPNERVAVGVRTVARHAEQHVARSEIIRARPQRITVYGSNDCPGDIDRTFGVHARHLGGLATEQRATDLLARLGHPGDDLGHDFGDEFGRGDVIEKEQRTGALHEDVVDTVVDEITAYAIPAAVAGGEFDLRAYTIGGGDETDPSPRPAVENRPPKAPSSESTAGVLVERTASPISFTARLPASMSTPASA